MRLLFVCTGNTCRSPLAAAIAQQVVTERALMDLTIESAGTSAAEGQPASDGAVLVGLEHQLDLTTHRARQLTPELVEAADLILAMGPHHLERLEALGAGTKAHLLTTYSSRGADGRAVSDPFGGDLEAYRATVEELQTEIRRVVDRLAGERAAS